MPITYRYDAENNILYEKGEEVVTVSDFISYRSELEELDMQSGLRCLADYRNARLGFSYSEMLSIQPKTENVTVGMKEIRVAVCAPDNLGYGMARMYSAVSNSEIYTVEVFRNIDDACQWLGIENLYF